MGLVHHVPEQKLCAKHLALTASRVKIRRSGPLHLFKQNVHVMYRNNPTLVVYAHNRSLGLTNGKVSTFTGSTANENELLEERVRK